MSKLSPIRKAARLLALLDDQSAANLVKKLSRRDRKALLAEAVVDHNSPDSQDEALAREFIKKTEEPQTERFAFLEKMDPESAATLVKDEMPSTIAAILMRLTPQSASSILSKLPLADRVLVVRHMATMELARDEFMRDVELVLLERVRSANDNTDDSEGLACLGRLIKASDPSTSLLLSATIERADVQLAQRLSLYR